MNRALPVAKFTAIALTLVCLIALPSAYLAAQATGGTIVGTVIDSTGAAVANADVEARSVGTNVAATAKTGDSGLYRFDNLLPGAYKITAKASGFKTISQTADVQVSRTFSLNLTLVPGSTSETIEVSGAPPLIDAATPDIGTTYETDTLRSIPTAGAGALGVINLSLLQSGVGSSGGLGAGTGPSVSGQRPRNNNFTVEGIDENDKGVTGPTMYVPNDAVGNFTILQNQFSPEFGHSTGGQFNTSILSGTNSFHGTAYEFFQNRNLNAIDNAILLTTSPGTAPKNPRFDENRFGGQIGGPIFKNKLFFFVNYERTPIGEASTPAAVSAPTSAGYTQLAAIVTAAGGNATNIGALQNWAVAPTGGTPLLVCDIAVPFGACPDGTQTPFVNHQVPIDSGTLPIQAPFFKNNSDLTTSMDYNLSDRDQIRGRYVYNKLTKIDNVATLPVFYTNVAIPSHLVSLAEFHTFTSALSNELRVGYMRTGFNYVVGNQTFLPTLDAFPNLTMDDLGLNVGPDPNAPQYSQQNLYQAVDNVTLIKGAHTLKFGVEGRKYISPQKFIQRSRGDYEWATLSDFAYDQDPLQDGDFAERSFGNVGYSGDQYAVYWYGNDIWKATRHLSLNFGLRYEFTSIPYGWTQQTLNSISDVPGLIHFGSPQAPKKDFMPRVGFAYSPGENGKMSIRGGFGLGYDVLYDNIGVLSRPPQIGSTVDCPQTCTQNAFLANGGIPFQNLSGVTVLDQQTARLSTSAFLPDSVKYPYGESWNIGVQRTFGSNYTAEVRYVGTRGVNLNVQNRINVQPIVTPTNFLPTFIAGCNAACQTLQASTTAPGQTTLATLTAQVNNLDWMPPAYLNGGFGDLNTDAVCTVPPCSTNIVAFEPWGASTYHGLQAQLEHRMSNGMFFQAAYTFSHMIDNSTADFFSTVIAPRRPQDFQNLPNERANSLLDHRQRFTLSLVYDTQWYNHSPNWFMKNIVGNYQITPVYFYETGQWATIQSERDVNLNQDNAGDRVILNPAGVSNRGSDVSAIVNQSGDTVGYFATDPTARYIRGGAGALTTSGRSTFASPAINNLDLGVSKGFKFGERMEFRFGLLAINALNHPQYTTGFVSQADSVSDTSAGQRNVISPAAANVAPQSVGLINFPNGIFGNFKAAFPSNARTLALNAHFSF
jgi:hypothetical protein